MAHILMRSPFFAMTSPLSSSQPKARWRAAAVGSAHFHPDPDFVSSSTTMVLLPPPAIDPTTHISSSSPQGSCIMVIVIVYSGNKLLTRRDSFVPLQEMMEVERRGSLCPPSLFSIASC
jgi:hypothetical protein